MCRDERSEVYLPLLSAIETIRSASILLVDDLAHLFWPQSVVKMVYPCISHDFQNEPTASLLGVRWAKYSENHHLLRCRLISGEELVPEEINSQLERLSSYLEIPIVRVAYSNDYHPITDSWEVQGHGDAKGIGAEWQFDSINKADLHEQLVRVLENAARNAPPRSSVLGSYIEMDDQPHWCSWLVNKDIIDFVLDNFSKILVLGKPSSVPYLLQQARLREINLEYRSDLTVPDGFECVLQTGSWGRPETNLPIFQIMGAGWPGEPAVNLPPRLSAVCPQNRL